MLAVEPSHSEVALSLGHSRAIGLVEINGNRAVSRDYEGQWWIWDLDSRTPLAGGADAALDVAGNTLLVTKGNLATCFNLGTGRPIGSIPAKSASGLSLDGSKAWTAGKDGLAIWTVAGDSLFGLAGDWTTTSPKLFGDTLALLGGRYDTLRLHSIAAKAPISESAIEGRFHSWFQDDRHFLTEQGDVVRVYTASGKRVALIDGVAGELLGGMGKHFWTRENRYPDYPLRIYPFTSGNGAPMEFSTEVLTLTLASGNSLASISVGRPDFNRFHLSSVGVRTDSCWGSVVNISAYAADTLGNWITGNDFGVLQIHRRDDPPGKSRVLNPGWVRSISGSKAGTFAVSTASGVGYVFRVESGRPIPTDTLPECGSRVRLTADGTLLFCQTADQWDHQYLPDRTIKAYSLTEKRVIKQWKYRVDTAAPADIPVDFDISPDGEVLVRELGQGVLMINRIVATKVKSDSLILEVVNPMSSGIRRVIASKDFLLAAADTLTKVYRNGRLLNVLKGGAAGWISDTRFLLRPSNSVPWEIHDPETGKSGDAKLDFCCPRAISAVSDSEIFVPESFSFHGLNSGNTLRQFLNGANHQRHSDRVGMDHVAYADGPNLYLFEWRSTIGTRIRAERRSRGDLTVRSMMLDGATGTARLRFSNPGRIRMSARLTDALGISRSGTLDAWYEPGEHRIEIPLKPGTRARLFLQLIVNGESRMLRPGR